MFPRWPSDFIGASGVILFLYCSYRWTLRRQKEDRERLYSKIVSLERAVEGKSDVYNVVEIDRSIVKEVEPQNSFSSSGIRHPGARLWLYGSGCDELNFLSPLPHLTDRAWIVACQAESVLRHVFDLESERRRTAASIRKEKVSEEGFTVLSLDHE